MELNEALRRIAGRHVFVLVACVLIGAIGAYLLRAGQPQTFSAETRLVLDTPDPQSLAEATTIADTARAIVTSPSRVANALTAAGSPQDPEQVAHHDISLETLGSSAILQLTVRDTNPRVAAAVATSLAKDLIDTRLEVTQGRYLDAVHGLDDQIQSINAKISRLRGAPGRGHFGQLDALAQQLQSLESSRANVVAAFVGRPTPLIIDTARVPRHPDPSHTIPDLALGALLGLLVGAGIAALLEAFRPTLVGSGAVARELQVPFLGELPRRPEVIPEAVADRLRLAAIGAKVKVVELIPTDESADLSELAHRLGLALGGTDGEAGQANGELQARGKSRSRASGAPIVVRTFTFGHAANGQMPTGFVAVAPSAVKKNDLDPVNDLVTITGWPLLGVITHPPRSRYGDSDQPSGGSAAPTEADRAQVEEWVS